MPSKNFEGGLFHESQRGFPLSEFPGPAAEPDYGNHVHSRQPAGGQQGPPRSKAISSAEDETEVAEVTEVGRS
mgnify:CR=1 FL=1